MANDQQGTFEAPETIGRMLVTTWALLYSMDGDQRRACEFPMADPGRVDWDFIPKRDRHGIPLARLDVHQRTLAQSCWRGPEHAGLQPGSADHGDGEHAPGARDQRLGLVAGDFRSQDQYYLAWFGRPSFEDTWGWRFLGHHLSLSYTIVGQR